MTTYPTYPATLVRVPSQSGGEDHLVTVVLAPEGEPLLTLCTCAAGQRAAVCHAQKCAAEQVLRRSRLQVVSA